MMYTRARSLFSTEDILYVVSFEDTHEGLMELCNAAGGSNSLRLNIGVLIVKFQIIETGVVDRVGAERFVVDAVHFWQHFRVWLSMKQFKRSVHFRSTYNAIASAYFQPKLGIIVKSFTLGCMRMIGSSPTSSPARAPRNKRTLTMYVTTIPKPSRSSGFAIL